MSKIYAGTSVFFANRKGSHNWLDNNARPMLSVIHTDGQGSKSYQDLFVNNQIVDVKVTKTKVTLTFDVSVNKPIFRVLAKES